MYFIVKQTDNIKAVKLSIDHENSSLKIDIYEANDLSSLSSMVSVQDLYILLYDSKIEISKNKIILYVVDKYIDRIKYLFKEFSNREGITLNDLQETLKEVFEIKVS